MTENLYETNQFINHTNGNYWFQNSPSAPHYGVPNVSSVQSSPMSSHLSHEHLASPVTPRNELSPLLNMPNGAESWDCSQFGRGSSWGSSCQEELSESADAFNDTTSKDGSGNAHLQRLDSFCKAFPSKNVHLLFEDSNRPCDNNSENHHIPGVLAIAQSGHLESPVFNPMAVQGQTQTTADQTGFHISDGQNPLHGLYQSHHHFHYGYQQHKQKVTHIEQMNRALHKPQSVWLQHGYQSHQTPFPISLNQQQQLHLQARGTFEHKTQLDEHESVQSPTYSHGQDFKSPENQNFSLLSPRYQDQQYLQPFSHLTNAYLHSQEHVQPVNQSNVFHDGHLHPYDKQSAPNTPAEEDGQSAFSFPHRSDDICKAVSQTTQMRGDLFPHVSSHAPRWSQASSPDIPSESISQHYRAENGRMRADTRMRCSVCQREFKSLPALNGHMRSHGGFRTHPSSLKTRDGQIHGDVFESNPIILPVSVPVKNHQITSKLAPHCHQKDDERSPPSALPPVRNPASCLKRSVSDGECESKQVKRRYRQCLVPLMIPPPGVAQESRGAVLFRSLLKTPVSGGDDVPYTPPPMLSPVRPGSGLFSALNGRTETDADVLHCQASDAEDSAVTLGQKVVNVTPRINIGEEFQAKIPEMSQFLIEEDTHNAVLLWMPTKDLDTPDTQQKVDDLLKMACSSVLPGGGTNTEYVLHCLFEYRGDILNTLEKLLLSRRNTFSPKTDYHYTGSDSWSPQEKRLLNKALLTHHKDFYLVQKVVKTKTVAQCVEYYYTWKKRLRLGTRVNSALATPVQDQQGDWMLKHLTPGSDRETKSKNPENSHTVFVCEVSPTNAKTWNQNNLGLHCSSPAEHRTSALTLLGSRSVRSSPSNSTTSGDTDSAVVFPCIECGKVFFKVKSRNAHMKTHRQQEPHVWQFPRVPEQDTGNMTSVTSLKQASRLHSADSTADSNTFSINESESVQKLHCTLKTVLHNQLDYIQS